MLRQPRIEFGSRRRRTCRMPECREQQIGLTLGSRQGFEIGQDRGQLRDMPCPLLMQWRAARRLVPGKPQITFSNRMDV